MPIFKKRFDELGSVLLTQYLRLGALRQVVVWCRDNDIRSTHKTNPYYTHQSIKNLIWKYAAFYPEQSYGVVCEYFDSIPLQKPPTYDEWFGFVVWYAMDVLASKQYRQFLAKHPNAQGILDEFKNGERELVKIG